MQPSRPAPYQLEWRRQPGRGSLTLQGSSLPRRGRAAIVLLSRASMKCNAKGPSSRVPSHGVTTYPIAEGQEIWWSEYWCSLARPMTGRRSGCLSSPFQFAGGCALTALQPPRAGGAVRGVGMVGMSVFGQRNCCPVFTRRFSVPASPAANRGRLKRGFRRKASIDHATAAYCSVGPVDGTGCRRGSTPRRETLRVGWN